jgi:hypothetical protein
VLVKQFKLRETVPNFFKYFLRQQKGWSGRNFQVALHQVGPLSPAVAMRFSIPAPDADLNLALRTSLEIASVLPGSFETSVAADLPKRLTFEQVEAP